jgi:hypothetical protein
MSSKSSQLRLPFRADEAGHSLGQILNEENLVHRWYDYVQGFPGTLVAQKIRDHGLDPSAAVLDPFCGSGTTLVTAKFLGLPNLGIEANPLMAFITEAKTDWKTDPEALNLHGKKILRQLERLSSAPGAASTEIPPIPMRSLNQWFKPETLQEILLARPLFESPNADDSIARKLRLAFSRAMFDASQVSMCPGITFTKKRKPSLRECLRLKLDQIVSDLREIRQAGLAGVKSKTFFGDARAADTMIPARSIDFIFTSPPYPTDIEYTRQTRAELYFLGFIKDLSDVQQIKKSMVRGSPKNIYKDDHNEQYIQGYPQIQELSALIAEKLKDKNWGWDYPRAVREYFGDMFLCLRAFRKILAAGGWCLLVVGDQTCKGIKIPACDWLFQIGKDLGYRDGYIEVFRKRRSTTHSISLDESIVALKK